MRRTLRWPRYVVAFCLALLYSFSSFAALVTTPSTAMSCCRTKAKSCCCHHSHSSDGGLELTAKTCASHCGQSTPAAKATYAANRTFTVAIKTAGAAHATREADQPFRAVPTTYQRPPPSLS
jgi:hypothetical protein